MSDKRWWSIPRMFVFPLWNSAGTSGVENHVQKAPCEDRCSPQADSIQSRSPDTSEDEEDMEEFLEKQRNARLGCKDNSQQVSVKSRKYSTPVSEEVPETGKFNRRSKRFSRSSSKSSTSTKYSSAGKTSDVENEKIIKETIYEVTGSAPPISFSFFQENPTNESEGCAETPGTVDETLYINSSVADDPINQIDQPDNTSNNVIRDQPDNWQESCTPRREIESPIDETFSTSGSSSKERHITKLTILLSPARNADPSQSPDCDRTSEEAPQQRGNPSPTDCLYSVIDKNTKTRPSTSPEPDQEILEDPLDNPDYAELSEFHSNPMPEITNMEYCQHRAKLKTRFRKLSLRRKRRTSSQPTLKKMNVNINRAWKSIRGWWQDEKSKLGHLRPKSFIKDDARCASSSSCSDRSFYESIRHLDIPEEKHFTSGQLDEDGYCTLELKTDPGVDSETDRVDADKLECDVVSEFSTVRRRSKAPHPPPLRMSTVNAFRKSKYIVQVSR